MSDIRIEENTEQIHRIARRQGALHLRVFGSYARGEATASSDLDLLVDLEPGRDLLDLVGLKQDLEELLGCQVDVVETEGLSPHLRQRVADESRAL